MAQIRSMTVVQTRIFAIDDVPFEALQVGQNQQNLRAEFGFKGSDSPLPFIDPSTPGSVTFQNGSVSIDGENVVVDRLTIEPVRIQLAVLSDSANANKVFDRLRHVLRSMDTRKLAPELKEVLLAEETTTVAKLAFPFASLLSEGRIGKFTDDLPSAIESHDAKLTVVPFSIRYRIHFDELPERLAARNIQLSTKYLTIEMRAQTSPADMIYFISSPSSSQKHLALVDRLEATFRS